MVEYLPPAGRIALAHHGRIEGCKPVGRKEYVADPDGVWCGVCPNPDSEAVNCVFCYRSLEHEPLPSYV